MIKSPSTSTFSMGIKVSAPLLISEPVKVFIQVPSVTSTEFAVPAGSLSMILILPFF